MRIEGGAPHARLMTIDFGFQKFQWPENQLKIKSVAVAGRWCFWLSNWLAIRQAFISLYVHNSYGSGNEHHNLYVIELFNRECDNSRYKIAFYNSRREWNANENFSWKENTISRNLRNPATLYSLPFHFVL